MGALYVVKIKAEPMPGSQSADKFGGAYINVYAKASSESAALEIAGREVAEAGWRSQSIREVALVTRKDFVDDSDGLEYFKQAQVDGIVVVVHTYPIYPDEDDVRH